MPKAVVAGLDVSYLEHQHRAKTKPSEGRISVIPDWIVEAAVTGKSFGAFSQVHQRLFGA